MYKYPLLLKQQLAFLPESTPHYELLQLASEHVKNSASTIDAIKKESELDSMLHGEVVVTRCGRILSNHCLKYYR